MSEIVYADNYSELVANDSSAKPAVATKEIKAPKSTSTAKPTEAEVK